MNHHHRLTQEQLDSIARGGGGPDAVAALRAGQLSKHIIMLLTMMELARESYPAEWERLDEGFKVLLASQRQAPDPVNALIEHPQVGLWAARCLRRLRGTGPESCPLAVELGQLGAIAAVAAVLGGQRCQLPVHLRQGTVYLPTLGLATFSAADPWAPATVSYDGLRVELSCEGQTVDVPADPSQDGPGWSGLRRLGSRPDGAEITVELVDIGPNRDGFDASRLMRLTADEVERWQDTFDGAWQILVDHCPDRAASIRSGLRSIALPDPERPSSPGMSASMKDAFGHFLAAFNDEKLGFAETLVHEFQHSKLTALSDLVPLHDGAEDMIYFAPWRQDARHIEGLFQGTYAFLAITEYWKTMRSDLDGDKRRLADFNFARWRGEVAEAIETLLGSGRLTSVGVHVAERMRETAASWHSLVIDDTAQQFADRVVADNRLCWRLANLHPDPAAVDTVAASWLAGHSCPLDVAEVEVEIATDGQHRLFERLALLRARLTQPSFFHDLRTKPEVRAAADMSISAADIAYAMDDYGDAEHLYSVELAQAARAPITDKVKLWAGLALATAQRQDIDSQSLDQHPEVVAAVYQEVTKRSDIGPDPAALASWLSAARVQQPA